MKVWWGISKKKEWDAWSESLWIFFSLHLFMIQHRSECRKHAKTLPVTTFITKFIPQQWNGYCFIFNAVTFREIFPPVELIHPGSFLFLKLTLNKGQNSIIGFLFLFFFCHKSWLTTRRKFVSSVTSSNYRCTYKCLRSSNDHCALLVGIGIFIMGRKVELKLNKTMADAGVNDEGLILSCKPCKAASASSI